MQYSDSNEENMNKIGSFTTLCINRYDTNSFRTELLRICDDNNVKLAFECIGGNTTGIILECLAETGKLYHYGNLSLRSITNLNTNDFIFKQKSLLGFWLFEYIKTNYNNFENFYKIFLDDFENFFERKTYDVDIQAIYNPDKFQEASKLYRSNMGNGKVLLNFSV